LKEEAEVVEIKARSQNGRNLSILADDRGRARHAWNFPATARFHIDEGLRPDLLTGPGNLLEPGANPRIVNFLIGIKEIGFAGIVLGPIGPQFELLRHRIMAKFAE